MALIKCPECGKDISDKAEACPNCAYPIAKLNKNNTVAQKESPNTDIEKHIDNPTYTDNAKSLEEELRAREERRRKRQEAARIKKRKARRKKIIIISCIAVVLIAIAAFFIFDIPANLKPSDSITTKEKSEYFSPIVEYIETNGSDTDGTIVYSNKMENGIFNLRYTPGENKFSVTLVDTVYTDTSLMSVISKNAVITFEKNSGDITYLTQLALAKGENDFRDIRAESTIKKSAITSDTVFDLSMAKDSTGAVVESDYNNVFNNYLHVLLESFEKFLNDSGIGLTLADVGFTNYVPTYEDRYLIVDYVVTDMTKADKVEPAPLNIRIRDLEINSAGTPELYVQFTNKSNKNIEVFDFVVECFDAYGDVVEGYGHYDYSACTYDEVLKSGETTSSDNYWGLYGFDLTKTVKVGIHKYKLAGEGTVEIPYDQIVWVSMN